MPKLKTNSSIAKRFTFTASGKVRGKKSLHNHILTKKSSKRKRHLEEPLILNIAMTKKVKHLMPYGN
jgi:large subunit ribosomal protein L35